MDRRTVLGLGMSVAAAGAFGALATPALAGDGRASGLPPDPQEKFPLWPGTAPGGAGEKGSALSEQITEHSIEPDKYYDRFVARIAHPHVAVFRPATPNGAALLILPGGGYGFEAFDGEGYQVSRRFIEAGITCFVLRYRLPSEGWADARNVPLQDAQRAIRLIRADAARFGIDPARTGVMGFSAGGHLAASLATRFDAPVYAPQDAADAQDARPSFAVLMYPVITLGPGTHTGSRDNLVGKGAPADLLAAYSCEKLVSDQTPPTFLALAADDDLVPPMENGVAMFTALRQGHVPAELHLFEAGGHGFGVRKAAGKPTGAWPDLLTAWLSAHNMLTKA